MIRDALLGFALLCTESLSAAIRHPQATTISDQKTASDSVTKGWLIEYPWPDKDDISQTWRRIPGTLVISRHGRVIRRFEADQAFRAWNFWNRGREVVVEEGRLHGPSVFERFDLRSGRKLETWAGDGGESEAPNWVRAVDSE